MNALCYIGPIHHQTIGAVDAEVLTLQSPCAINIGDIHKGTAVPDRMIGENPLKLRLILNEDVHVHVVNCGKSIIAGGEDHKRSGIEEEDTLIVQSTG